VIGREGPEHKALRRIANDALSAEFVETLKPGFDAIARDLAAALPAAGEFMGDFSTPFAGRAIATLLDMDQADWPRIAHDASDLGLAMGVEAKRHEARTNVACDRLMDLAADLVARARAGGDAGGYVARLTAGFDASDFGAQDLLDMIVISIFGGVDTTRSQLGHLMTLFAAYPEEWDKLRADPALAAAAVEESIRARPTTTWATREALEDFTHDGVEIRKGETIHLFVHASARDPLICDNPEFSLTAERRNHFGFGGGAHHCLGSQMARADMAAALRALAARIESFEIDGAATFLPDSGNTGPARLPLRCRFA
jgi:cytochrome P450